MRYTIALALTLTAIAGSGPVAQQPQDTKAAAQATGALPAGWKARLDDPAAKPDAVRVAAERESFTFTSGPGGIYYKPGMNAEKNYTASATFSQLKPSLQPQPYGLFVAGANLDKDNPHYTALLIRSDGKYQISSWTAGQPTVIVNWTASQQMREPKGVKTTNTLTIRALQDAVHFLIAEKEVHQMPRAKAGADGLAGIRIGPGLNVQVDKFAVKKFP